MKGKSSTQSTLQPQLLSTLTASFKTRDNKSKNRTNMYDREDTQRCSARLFLSPGGSNYLFSHFYCIQCSFMRKYVDVDLASYSRFWGSLTGLHLIKVIGSHRVLRSQIT